MATLYSPKIVTNGLVLCLDATNPKSYPSSGTIWYDLSGNSYNATLVNGPTSNNYGMVLDGTNDYGYISHGGSLAFNSGNFTVCVWHRNENSSTGYNGIITNDNTGDDSWKMYRDNGQSYYQARCNTGNSAFPSYTVGRFHHYAYTFNGSTIQLYFDAVSGNSAGASSPASGMNSLAFGSYRYSNAVSLAYLTNQTIGGVYLYNRALTASEVLQNYNANKGRFGL
jgi:hypothetical protein